MIRYTKFLHILSLLSLSFQIHAALPSKSATEPLLSEELKEKYKKWLKKADLGKDQVSFSLLRLDNLQTVDSYNANSPFIPASLTKVFTCYYALSHLGAEYRFETKLFYDGVIKNGVLEGDIYLLGGADPILTHARLFDLALALKTKGIQKVTGKLYYDDSYIKEVKMISIIGLGDQTYNPSVSALSSEFNRFTIWNTRKESIPIPSLDSIMLSKTREVFDPGRNFKYIENIPLPDLKSKTEEEIVYGSGKDPSLLEHWQLSSRNRYHTREDVPIRKPSLYTASTFRFLAQKIGIILSYPERKSLPSSVKVISKNISPPLHEIVRLTLEYSNNMMAESLLLVAAKKATGKSLELKESARHMQIWLKSKFPTVKWDDIYLINGSGLTSANTVNSHELTHFFAKVAQAKFQDVHFWSLLSISGKTGWLKKRFPSPQMSYNIWAKTGSLDYVNNISGYLFSKSGTIYAFSILVNDLDKRKIVDGDNSARVDQFRRKATRWKNKSNSIHHDLLEHWVNNY